MGCEERAEQEYSLSLSGPKKSGRSLAQGSVEDARGQYGGVVAFDVVEVRLLDPKKPPADQLWLVRGRAWVDIHVGDRLLFAGHQAVVEAIASYGRDCDELNAMVTGDVKLKLLGSGSRLLALEQVE